MKNILADIKNNNYKSVYLLCGTEDYLKKQYRDKIKKGVMGDDDSMNYSYFEGKGVDVKEVVAIAGTMPFFADHRLVVVENSQLLKTSSDDDIVDLVNNMPESTILVFVETDVDKRNRLYKAIKEHGYICELNTQSDNDIMTWVLSNLKKEGLNISRPTMELFLSKTGTSMENIRRELDKLVSYVYGRDVITDKDVEEICTEQTVNRIFEMINAMARKNRNMALQLYNDLLTLKEPPMKILMLISRQFNQLLMIKELTAEGENSQMIAKKMGIQSFLIGKLQSQANAFSSSRLKSAISECVEFDHQIKSGLMDDTIAVEMIIVKYSE